LAAKKKTTTTAKTKSTSSKSSATAKTTAAKQSTAKKPATKKNSAKKPATNKTAAKKPPAKKPAAKSTKPAVKKPVAKATKPAVKKPAATTTKPKDKVVDTEPAKKPAIPFAVGDKVVYPHHGAATIIKKRKIDVGGEKRDYFILEIATDQLTVSVPVDSAVDLGVRPVISKNKAKQVFAALRSEPQEAGSNWSRWYKILTEKINSGDIFQVAEVIRDLDYAQKVKGISPALKRMLAKARLIIISELQFSLNISEEEAVKKLERALPKIEELVEA
jgi:CarD family transcriptional regulator